MSELAAALLEKIQSRRARTGVVGLGYVGLPLAVELARAGFHATGIDLDERKVDAIEAGPVVHPRRRDGRRHGADSRPAGSTPRRTSPSSRISTPSTSACRRRSARPRTPTCPTSSRRSRRSRSTCTRACSSSSSRRRIRERPTKSCSRCSRRRGSRPAWTSSSRSRPSASIRATRRSTPTTCRRSSAA